MRIYEIDPAIEAAVMAFEEGVEEVIDQETGEIKPLAAYIDELKKTKEEKIKALALICKEKKSFIEDLKAEKKRVADLQRVEENKLQNALDYLAFVTEGKGYKDAQFVISYRKSEAIEIDDDADVPDEAITMEPKISKTWLKEAIKDGAEFHGIRLVTKQNMSLK